MWPPTRIAPCYAPGARWRTFTSSRPRRQAQRIKSSWFTQYITSRRYALPDNIVNPTATHPIILYLAGQLRKLGFHPQPHKDLNQPRFIELLSPARDLECGLAALHAGADAIYIGPPAFGARKKAGNPLGDIEKLVKEAHRFRVKVYATLNTLLYDEELKPAEELAHRLHNVGVDAFIVQDMAWLTLALPPVALHASTQTDCRTPEKAVFLQKSGFKRVVLARELSRKAIEKIHLAAPSLELEAFVHGALCVSYSGQCYLSQQLFNRSASRGECAQPCRLPYQIADKNGNVLAEQAHALSLRDLNRAESIEQLIDAGITSLKIEGRLKNSEYAQNITAFYHLKLQELLSRRRELKRTGGGDVRIPYTPDPTLTFSRPYTQYFTHTRPRELACLITPKALGQPVGKVQRSGTGYIELDRVPNLANGDGIAIAHGESIHGARANRIEGKRVYTYGLQITPTAGDEVFCNHSTRFTELLNKTPAARTIPLTATVRWNDDRSVTLTLEDGANTRGIATTPTPIECAKNSERQSVTWETQLQKSGIPCLRIEQVTLPNGEMPFLPIGGINQLRRDAIDAYLNALDNGYTRPQASALREVVPYPATLPNDFRLNIANRLAKEFYEKRGVERIEYAPETGAPLPKYTELMRTKYCLRHELGICCKQNSRCDNSPLFLTHKGVELQASFDCQKCEMVIEVVRK